MSVAQASTPTLPQPGAGLLSLRAFYFFNFGALGGLFPYLPLLFASRGLNAEQISWVMAVVPLSGLLVPVLWGMVADAFHLRLTLLRVASVGCGLATLLLLPDHGLGGALLALLVLSFFRAPVVPLGDAATFQAMGGGRADFSKVRVWGSVGFVIFAFSMGQLSASQRPALLVGVVAVGYLISAAVTWPLRAARIERQPGVLAETLSLLRRPELLLFLAGNVIYYLGHSCYDAFFSLHARDLGLDDSWVGSAWAIGVGVEIGVMLLAPRFLHRVASGRLLAVAAAVASLRWLGTALLSSGPLLVGLQGLHGVTFGLWYLAMVKFVQMRAPEHLRTSLQSVALSGVGLGMVGGFLGGGQLLQRISGEALYLAASAAAAVATLLYLLATRLQPAGEVANGE